MRAHASVVLYSGFRGIDFDLPMADDWFAIYKKSLSVKGTSSNRLEENLGAATLVVQLKTDDGRPAGWLSWRPGAVTYQSRAGTRTYTEQGESLLDWFANGVAGHDVTALPSSWKDMLSSKLAKGESHVRGIPPTPVNSPQCPSAKQTWMTGPWDDMTHNCYSYACDASSGALVPGEASGEPITYASDPLEIASACERDGLKPVPEDDLGDCRPNGHFIAVIRRPKNLNGFHCFRLNRDGSWSHKDGSRLARQVDDLSLRMPNLANAWFHYGDKFKFVGYFHCPPGHLVK